MIDGPMLFANQTAEALAQDFMCCIENLASLRIIENHGQMTAADKARRTAIRQMAIQLLCRIATAVEKPAPLVIDNDPKHGQS
jgi:hypothetical protein